MSRAGAPSARADLHTHSTASDGLLSPDELVGLASQRGLSAIAITDHDTVEGVEEALTIPPSGLLVVPGVELSCSLDDVDVHLLGYGFDIAASGLRALLTERGAERRSRAVAIVERLAGLGAAVTMDRVATFAGSGPIGRPHIARALVEAGHATGVGDAFERYLGTGRPAYVERSVLLLERAIRQIHAAGGSAVLAHPLYSDGYGDFLPGLVESGLDGLEVVYPDHSAETRRSLSSLASRYNLIETGGTDFHGDFGRAGKGLGETTVPLAVIEQLAARASRRRSIGRGA